MRVALVTDGSYPYVTGGVSAWCHQLVAGLGRHTFHVNALTDAGRAAPAAYPLPANVASLRPHPRTGRPVPPALRHRRQRRRAGTAAAVLLCRGLLGHGEPAATTFADGLRRLAELAAEGHHPLYGVPLAEVLADAGRASREAPVHPDDPHPPLPRLSLRDARAAAALLEQATGALCVRLPDTDLTHAVNGGPPLLVALAAWWRTGTPFLLTEHGSHVREWSLAGPRSLPSAVRAVLLRFHRAVARLGYGQARLVAPTSRFHQRWALRHGAPADRTVVVPPAVDPLRFPPVLTEPERPTVVWTGQFHPQAALDTLISAFGLVHEALPTALLTLIGTAPGHPADVRACRELAQRLHLGEAVRLRGPLTGDRQAYASGQVVAVPGGAESTPYTLVEAMACGRATVSADLGAIAETVGDTGLVVPPADPAAFAGALLDLLGDPARRRHLGAAARRRALAHFTTDRLVRVYDEVYRDVATPPPGPPVAHELALAGAPVGRSGTADPAHPPQEHP